MTTVYRLVVSAILAVACTVSPVHAQPAPRFFVGGTIGTFSVTSDDVDGRAAAGGVVAGLALSRIVDVAVEWTRPTSAFRRSDTGIGVSFAPPGSSGDEI